jgi:hypothetical protein
MRCSSAATWRFPASGRSIEVSARMAHACRGARAADGKAIDLPAVDICSSENLRSQRQCSSSKAAP